MASSLPLSLSPGLASTLGLIAEGTRRTGAQGAAGSPVGATRKGKVWGTAGMGRCRKLP